MSDLTPKAPTLERTRTYSVAEHEVLLAFFTDADAEAFREWWAEQGRQSYQDWTTVERGQDEVFGDPR